MLSILAFLAVLASLCVVGMSMQFGTGRIGAPALVASAMVEAPFTAIPVGPIGNILLRVRFTGISTNLQFNLSVLTGENAAAEGTDDLDLVLNACLARLALHWDPSTMCGDLTPAQWRTVLGLLNQRDFQGSFRNGVAVPVAGGATTAYEVDINFPLDLKKYFDDGRIFTQGSERIRQGKFEFTGGASLAPTVALANGSIVIGALTVAIEFQTGAGTAYDAAGYWRVRRPTGLPLIHDLPAGTRIALMDLDVTGGTTAYTFGDHLNASREGFIINYQGERLASGGFDITNRCVPLQWLGKDKTFLDLLNYVDRGLHYEFTTTLGAVGLYEIAVIERAPDAAAAMGQRVASGGELAVTRPTPKSVPAGSSVPAALDGLLPMRIMPASLASGPHARFANPEALARHVAATPQRVASATRGRNILDKTRR